MDEDNRDAAVEEQSEEVEEENYDLQFPEKYHNKTAPNMKVIE